MIKNRKSTAIAVIALLIAGTAIAVAMSHRSWGRNEPTPFTTAPVSTGDITMSVTATGVLTTSSTVTVGSEVSGTVRSVLVSNNEEVHQGQVLAEIDPATTQARLEQERAALTMAQASLNEALATERQANFDYDRKRELSQRQLVSRNDAEIALVQRDRARAQVQSARAQVGQRQAAVNAATLDMGKTQILSPIDGTVLVRSVEPGQTLASSLQAPVLFTIAADMTRLEMRLSVDEADIGGIAPDQKVTFGVDAFPDQVYEGKVKEVLIAPATNAGVVTYPVVVSVDNSSRKLLPGMTANAEITTSHRAGVLRVANDALGFKPQGTAKAQVERDASAAPDLGVLAAGEQLKLTPEQRKSLQSTVRMTLKTVEEVCATRPMLDRTKLTLQIYEGVFREFRARLTPDQAQRWDTELAAIRSARLGTLYSVRDGHLVEHRVRVGASDTQYTEVVGAPSNLVAVVTGLQSKP